MKIQDSKLIKNKIFYDLEHLDILKFLRSEYIKMMIDNKLTTSAAICIHANSWLTFIYHCKLIEHFFPSKNAQIVDWGGAYGYVTQILRAMGYSKVKNYLLYILPSYELFKNRFKIPTVYGKDPNKLNLSDESVDVFISSAVLEHVREDGIVREEIILKEINRVLKPNGLLFIWNLPTMLGLSEILSIILKKYHHKYRYSKGKILHLYKIVALKLSILIKIIFFQILFSIYYLMEKLIL